MIKFAHLLGCLDVLIRYRILHSCLAELIRKKIIIPDDFFGLESPIQPNQTHTSKNVSTQENDHLMKVEPVNDLLYQVAVKTEVSTALTLVSVYQFTRVLITMFT